MWGHRMVQSKRFWNVVGEVDGENLSSALSQREERERESNCLEYWESKSSQSEED